LPCLPAVAKQPMFLLAIVAQQRYMLQYNSSERSMLLTFVTAYVLSLSG
jgi:hypothetical protein